MMKQAKYAGVMISEAPFINMPTLFKGCGLDFVIVDTEHGGFDYSTLAGMIMNARQCELTIIIRIPDNQRRDVTRMMDMGADGLLLPMTNCAEDIRKVVEYAKYAPIGKRGISTTRAHTNYNPPALKEYMKAANERTMVFAQIETAAGIDAIEEILNVEGVAGVMVGPNDLACDLDCIGQDEPVIEAMERVAAAATKADKHCGVITAKESLLKKAGEFGMQWFSIGSELNMMKVGCKAVVNNVKLL